MFTAFDADDFDSACFAHQSQLPCGQSLLAGIQKDIDGFKTLGISGHFSDLQLVEAVNDGDISAFDDLY
jgi:hypothetical protein